MQESKGEKGFRLIDQPGLKEGPLVVTAEILTEGGTNSSCTQKYSIASDNQNFTTSVDEGQPHHFKIEHLGNGIFNITMDSNETLSLDLSSVPEFASTAFSAEVLSTASRGTDTAGEETFIRALFDNVRAGSL